MEFTMSNIDKAKKLAKYTESLATGHDWGVDDQDTLEWLITKAESGWISFDDEVPDELGKEYIFYEPKCIPAIYTMEFDGYLEVGITHWMPLPGPPESKNGKR